jgi:hypothetical protein
MYNRNNTKSTVQTIKNTVNTSKHFTLMFIELIPRNIVLAEKLAGVQPLKKFSVFYGTRDFITVFT